ncbi:MAG: hypothetical protein U1C18_01420, partial [Patescibacteria group bacterium]|nr:hypothetical protein [Patescibacteria group bacterium]
MQKREFTHQSQPLSYYIRGDNPGLLLLSGAHGDEYQVIDSVAAALGARTGRVPDFLYIPHVSPSSVAKGTRTNYRGCDINRQFVKESDDTEAQTVMALLKGRAFDACISFHEDPQLSEFYMY